MGEIVKIGNPPGVHSPLHLAMTGGILGVLALVVIIVVLTTGGGGGGGTSSSPASSPSPSILPTPAPTVPDHHPSPRRPRLILTLTLSASSQVPGPTPPPTPAPPTPVTAKLILAQSMSSIGGPGSSTYLAFVAQFKASTAAAFNPAIAREQIVMHSVLAGNLAGNLPHAYVRGRVQGHCDSLIHSHVS
jgi:hypothetical protein